jgi:2'-5' RNA ligase
MRLFFALWPDATATSALAAMGSDLAARTGGKPVPPGKIHLTVAFLGDIDEARLDPAKLAAGAVREPGFEVVLDQAGSFRGARVAWAGCAAVPVGLARLQEELTSELRGRGFVLEDRPFAAHVTLVRRIARPLALEAIAPIRWRARELSLVRSELGTGRYRPEGAWDLL